MVSQTQLCWRYHSLPLTQRYVRDQRVIKLFDFNLSTYLPINNNTQYKCVFRLFKKEFSQSYLSYNFRCGMPPTHPPHQFVCRILWPRRHGTRYLIKHCCKICDINFVLYVGGLPTFQEIEYCSCIMCGYLSAIWNPRLAIHTARYIHG